MEKISGLCLTFGKSVTVTIGDEIKVKCFRVKSNQWRMVIKAPKEMPIKKIKETTEGDK